MGEKYFYEEKYWEWGDLSAHLDREFPPEFFESGRIARALAMAEGSRVLDLGCFIGLCSHHLALRGHQVVGVDVDENCIEIARRKHSHPKLSFEHTDGRGLEFDDASFDCVLLLEVLEHSFNPRGLVAEIHRVLKPGGCLIVSVPNASSYHTLARSLLLNIKSYYRKMESWPAFAVDQRDHFYYWEPFTLYRLLNVQGFKYVDHAFRDNFRFIEIISRFLPPLKKVLTCYILKVRKG